MNKPRIKKVNPKWWQCSDGDDVGFGKSMRAAFIKWRDNPEVHQVGALIPLHVDDVALSIEIPDCKREATVNITYDCPNCRTIAHIEATHEL
tara:strand:- start:23508 stop:23783 length:276 start_codon:yes stop_codon:yes gene_type:complete